MYIRRKVFSVGIDEYGEERLFSVNEVISEEAYQRLFAKAEKEAKEEADEEEESPKKLRLGDKIGIWAPKHLSYKKYREAMIDALDQEGPRNSHKLGKESAKIGAALGGVMGATTGYANNGIPGAIAGGLGGAATSAGASYLATRGAHRINKIRENISTNAAERAQLVADRNKVASELMSKEEYAKKHGRKKAKK